MMLKKLIALSFTLIFTSCAGFVDGVHRDLEKKEMGQNTESDYDDEYFASHYKPNQKRRTSSEYNRPGRKNGLSTSSQKNLNPQIKRQYVDEKVATKRYTASDFADQSNDGSLWSGGSNNSYLFTSSRNKATGDIVQINVFNRLKTEISQELGRAFPENPFDKAKEGQAPGADAAALAATTPAPATPEAELPADASQDKISGVVVEEINKEHLLIKGRKSIVFKNKKRMVEVQALVSRRDIAEDDSINSDSIIESNVTVVR